MSSTGIPLRRHRIPSRGTDPLWAFAMFKQGRDPVPLVMRRLVRRLERAGIVYAVMGGLAVFAHGHERLTNDVDILLTRAGLEEFRKRFIPKFYEQDPKRGRRFRDRKDNVTVDILVTGLYPGRGLPGPIAFPDPDAVRQRIDKIDYIDFATLIQLKLAAHRHQDFADVVSLVDAHDLDESFAKRLHPSVRQDYIECLEEKRREDEYLKRNG
jgi:hypothetical protein